MKLNVLFFILLAGLFVYGCKKQQTIEYRVIEGEKPVSFLITSPTDSAMVHDTAAVTYTLSKTLNIVRTECYVDYTLNTAWDSLPARIYFYANKFVMGSIHSYYLRIIAKDGSMYNSNIVTLVISKLARPVPAVDFISKSALRLTWADNSNEETGYHVFRREGGNAALLIGDLPKNSTSFTDNTIDTTHSFSYQVEVFSARESLISDPLNVSFLLDKYMPLKYFSVATTADGKIAMTPDGTRAIITNYFNDTFTLLDLAGGSKTELSQTGGTLGLAMSHNGNFFITAGTHTDLIKIWDLSSLTLIRQFVPQVASFEIRISITDDQVAVGGEPVNIHNIQTGARVLNFNNGSSFTRGMVYSADGAQLLTGGNDNLVNIWNAATGALIKTYTGHTGHVGCVCFSPDETQIFSGSYEDNTVKIWDRSSGALLNTIYRNDGVVSIHLTSDGNVMAAAMDGTVLIMTPAGQTVQEIISPFRWYSADYNSAAGLIAAYGSGSVQLYKKIGHWEKIT